MSVKSIIVLNVLTPTLAGPMLFVMYNTNDIWNAKANGEKGRKVKVVRMNEIRTSHTLSEDVCCWSKGPLLRHYNPEGTFCITQNDMLLTSTMGSKI